MRQLVARAGGAARSATLRDVAQASEVLLLATPWPATKEVLEGLGELGGKVLIDATNPLRPRLDGLELGNTTSDGEQVAAWACGASVVKAFNTIGFNIMANPAFGSDHPALFYCGDDASSKQTVKQLAEGIGFQFVRR
jgi:predicted dinucleotide-binding enzyme